MLWFVSMGIDLDLQLYLDSYFVLASTIGIAPVFSQLSVRPARSVLSQPSGVLSIRYCVVLIGAPHIITCDGVVHRESCG